jgi:hypothetical protein
VVLPYLKEPPVKLHLKESCGLVGSMYHIFVFVEEPPGYYTLKKVLGFLFLDAGYLHAPQGKANFPVPGGRLTHGLPTLIKKRIKLPSYIRKFRGIGCKVVYD